MGTLFMKLLVGGAAGFLAWLIMEPFSPGLASTAWDTWEANTVLLLGALVGVAVAGLDGFTRGGKVHTLRGAGLGFLCGAVGASLGHGVGGGLSHGIFGGTAMQSGILPLQMLARVVAFVPIGFFLGAAIGGASLNLKKAIQGATGGAIGAAIAGLLFDPIGSILGNTVLSASGVERGEVGGPSRAVFFLVMGGAIGLFIGLVERLTRSAWIRLHLGRNEGKEWAIDSSTTFIGRSETAHIPLRDDPNIAPVHATITKTGGQYILTDGGSPLGTYVNGQRIGQIPLWHGAMIGIGGLHLEFLTKNIRVPQPTPGYMPQPVAMTAQQPMPAGMAPTQMLPSQPMAPTQAMPSAMSMPTQAYAQSPAAGFAPSGFALVAMDGPLAGQRFPVSVPLELGRESPSIPMSYDTNASRRHASVVPVPSGLQVTDLGSTNGTYVNGQRIAQTAAAPGSTIKVGSTTFRVEA